jgi:uncharacterized protein YjbI with pentapeptide repeats
MSPEVTAAIIAASVSFLTLIGTLAAQYLSRSATRNDLKEQGERLDRTLAVQRTRTLNERFATAAEQLGSDKPAAVRLAGVYAMAGLADDWEENRQTCVDVLCGYLRMPYEPDPGDEGPEPERLAFRASREVRHTVIRVITAHLKDDVVASWQGLNFDFTGVVFDGGDFGGAVFSGGTVDFSGARFSGGKVNFRSARFSGGVVSFDSAWFSGGTVDFILAEFSGGKVFFSHALFSGGRVLFDAVFSSGQVSFYYARFSGGEVSFGESRFSGADISFAWARFSGGNVDFIAASFSGGEVTFRFARVSGGEVDFSVASFSGGRVIFCDAEFSGGTVRFGYASFSGGTVRFSSGDSVIFRDAKFSGSLVDFTAPEGQGDWSCPPAFPWTDTPPPGVKLPGKEQLSQG